MSVQYLYTGEFPVAIESIKTMANSMEDLVQSMDLYKAQIIKNWVGEGRNEFEKMYTVIRRKLKDGTDVTWDMHELLMAASEKLIQTDIDTAKAIDGKYEL